MIKLNEEKKSFINTIGDPSRLKILLALWKSDQELTVSTRYVNALDFVESLYPDTYATCWKLE